MCVCICCPPWRCNACRPSTRRPARGRRLQYLIYIYIYIYVERNCGSVGRYVSSLYFCPLTFVCGFYVLHWLSMYGVSPANRTLSERLFGRVPKKSRKKYIYIYIYIYIMALIAQWLERAAKEAEVLGSILTTSNWAGYRSDHSKSLEDLLVHLRS